MLRLYRGCKSKCWRIYITKLHNRVKILLVVLLVASGCSSPNYCFEDMTTAFKVKLYRMVYDATQEKYVEQSCSVPVTVYGLGNDSMLYDLKTTSSLALPLMKLDTLSTFIVQQMKVEEGDTSYIEDTLWINHTNGLEFVSLECGCASIYTVNSVGYSVNGIDSVKILNTSVDRTQVDNLKIYLRK